jgi:hypothetical protein
MLSFVGISPQLVKDDTVTNVEKSTALMPFLVSISCT